MDPISLGIIFIGKALLGKGAAVATAKVVGAAAVGAAATTAVLAYIYWEDILSWFKKYSHQIDNKDTVARTILKLKSDGNYKVIKQVFRKSSQQVIAQDMEISEHIDPQLAKKHSGKKTVQHYIS